MKRLIPTVILLLSAIWNCNENTADFAILSAPVAYSLAKNAIKQEKPDGQITIVASWQSLNFENNQWPHGNLNFIITTPDYPGKKVYIQYVFNGTYTATAIVTMPDKKPTQYQVNLYESALILGQAASAETYIQDIAKKISPSLKDRKVAVLDFQGVLGEKNIFGKRIAESFISTLASSNVKVVERKLLDPLLDEMKFQTDGLAKGDGNEVRNKIGKFLGANTIITGTIKNEREELIINARAIDLTEGLILGASQTVIPKYLIKETDLVTMSK
ncbi:hypothetical protein LPTSP3_g30870 [Leptospira kobayashii]|uniref:FlgO domain-containing protein n=1 Tax=Leptospira kobayashii TaxID=1917830 RepID=A0ABM7UM99_9LEPT|nr:FlgO family outer membrane protein [Leptospira kobayashii]BDA80157.1 hypothetical protein LPTSP3_g30870 [Leptospira kobayashii]